MTRSPSRLLLVLLTGSAPVSVLAGQQAPATLIARIDSVVGAELDRTHAPAASVAVESRGQLLLARGYGLANVEAGTHAGAETIYRIGSLTKQFTATAIMQLVEAGKIGLDEDVKKYLPDYPTQGNRVTIRHLLTHTSGIKSYTGIGPQFWNEASRLDLTDDQMLALFKDLPFDFKPGERYLYNNSAFYLLGVIIGKVAGIPYRQYVRDKLFAPLGLTATSYCDDRPIIPHRAGGYEVQGAVVTNAVPLSLNTPGAAGALCSNVLDLLTWQHGFDAARLITPASRDQIRTSAVLNDGKPTNYGFGVAIRNFEGHRSFAHSGGINGFATWLARYPDDDLTVVVLTNSGSGPATRIGDLIARVMLGIPLPTLADLPPPAADRAALVGRYTVAGAPVVITDGPPGLMIAVADQEPERLLHQGNSAYAWKSMPEASLTLETSNGTRQVVVTIQGNRMVATPAK
ncbi:MAG: serine hydrolase domain-containing protein [Gemmatimonadales bacterium]